MQSPSANSAPSRTRSTTSIPSASGASRNHPATCESNVSGLYIAGTLQAGRDLGKIFIENSRRHAPLIARHLAARLERKAGR